MICSVCGNESKNFEEAILADKPICEECYFKEIPQ